MTGQNIPAWQYGPDSPAYEKGTVVSWDGRYYRARDHIKAAAKTNSPGYSGYWEEVAPSALAAAPVAPGGEGEPEWLKTRDPFFIEGWRACAAPSPSREGVGPPISLDGPHKPGEQRQWLARQLLDSRLDDEEAFSVVAFHPDIKDAREGVEPEAGAVDHVAWRYRSGSADEHWKLSNTPVYVDPKWRVEQQPLYTHTERANVMAAEDAPVWAEGIVTNGERVAFAQKAEADYGGTYWATDEGDGALEWEPTHFIARAALGEA